MAASRPLMSTIGPAVLIGGALLVGVLVAGCDEYAADAGRGAEVVLDLRPLFRTAADERCVSVVDVLLLTVTDADGTEQVLTRQLTPEDAEVRIPVRVNPGSVRFDAAVRSNNGALLYTGSAPANVQNDGFRVEVPLNAVSAVLKACPDVVPIVLNDGVYWGEFRLMNRGDRAVSWEATPCQLEPFHVEVCRGALQSGGIQTLFVSARAITLPYAVDVRVTSAVGTLDVRFVATTGGPGVRPDAVVGRGSGFYRTVVHANGANPGDAPPSESLYPWIPSR